MSQPQQSLPQEHSETSTFSRQAQPDGGDRVRFAQIGGGPDSFIGAVHRMAARLDGQCELVAGAFSSDRERSRQTGLELGLDSERISGDWQQLLASEARRRPSERAEFINIVTPNHLHAPIARAALELGFHVLCDKPLCRSSSEANELLHLHRLLPSLLDDNPSLFGVTYNYSGYPMVREAQDRVHGGAVGALRKVMVEYTQGWLAQRIEQDHQKQAEWRTDPARAGAAGAIGDIGTHAAHLVEFVTGRTITAVCADLSASFSDRQLDDNGSVFLRFSDDSKGLLTVNQIAVGRENGLRLRIFGSEGSLEWFQEEPNSLLLDSIDQPRQVLRTGGPGVSDAAARATRLPAGHPEGFIEAFANLYRDFSDALKRRRDDPTISDTAIPCLDDGVRGMRLIEAIVASNDKQAWVEVPTR